MSTYLATVLSSFKGLTPECMLGLVLVWDLVDLEFYLA